MPGALKAREADSGRAMEFSSLVAGKCAAAASSNASGQIEVDALNSSGNDGTLFKKKKRKKRRNVNPSSVEDGSHLNKPLDRMVRHDMDTPSNCTSLSKRNASCVTELKQARELPTGNCLEPIDAVKVSGNLKPNKKKRKRHEDHPVNEAASSSVAKTEETTVKAHERVWQYVCNRAVVVNSGSVPDSVVPSKPGYGRNTVVTEIHVAGKKIVVTNTKEGAVAQAWLKRQIGKVFGLDAEWRPSFRKGVEHKIALLQICGEDDCLIVQMLYLDSIPTELVNFLKDPSIKFPGVGIKGDALKLKRDWGLECNGAIDLTTLAASVLGRPELKAAGLKSLAKVVMDYDMAKPKRVTMSNWAKPILDKVQVEYASLDAWVSYAIHQKLFQPALETGLGF
ncbi:uncharacterized protein [Physcomitrium patens]|uniref:3'-5' exonuclease domain-containing protein n=1 Tax=Physcomitrium patens TaxID=3218 RepID=A0A2K1L2S9_PHYPA|nr:uncharacterized protein LOC112278681 [Physcomitrium patens]PNR60338.1 hypothetical protein PHYPA_003131 [Physcomitrium patens]|eukprot:XP_024368071.1 uncharacterized protein LOC112278681 [Physcomitrella patens]